MLFAYYTAVYETIRCGGMRSEYIMPCDPKTQPQLHLEVDFNFTDLKIRLFGGFRFRV